MSTSLLHYYGIRVRVVAEPTQRRISSRENKTTVRTLYTRVSSVCQRPCLAVAVLVEGRCVPRQRRGRARFFLLTRGTTAVPCSAKDHSTKALATAASEGEGRPVCRPACRIHEILDTHSNTPAHNASTYFWAVTTVCMSPSFEDISFFFFSCYDIISLEHDTG